MDAQYFTWSRYDKYVIDITYPSGFPEAEPETVLENWKNTWIARLGLQYELNESLALRGGIIYDWTPQPVESIDPNLPDANRYALTARDRLQDRAHRHRRGLPVREVLRPEEPEPEHLSLRPGRGDL